MIIARLRAGTVTQNTSLVGSLIPRRYAVPQRLVLLANYRSTYDDKCDLCPSTELARRCKLVTDSHDNNLPDFSFRIVIGEGKNAGQYQRSSHVIQVIK